MREDCASVISLLQRTPAAEWAETFVSHKCFFWRKHCLGLIFSTIHGPDFFENVLQCLDGRAWEPENKGEYEENFRKFIRHYRRT